MRPRRLYALIVLIFAGLILSGFSQNPAVISLVIPLVVYLALGLATQSAPLQIEVNRELAQSVTREQVEFRVQLSVTNQGEALEEVHLADTVPAGLTITEGSSTVITQLDSGETFTWEYSASGNRGEYHFDDVHITAYELFGLLSKHTAIQSNRRIAVLPTLQRMDRVTIRPQRTRGFAGPIPSRQPGSGTAFFGLREYQPGDPQRWLNWRVSARHEERLYSNQFEQERIADVGIILDARLRNEIEIDSQSLFEYGVTAAGSIAQAFLEDGNRVALLVYGRGLEWVTPGYGKIQSQRIQHQLTKAKIGDSQAFDSLDYLPTQMFPAKSQIVLVSPLSKVDIQMLARIHARGYSVLVISPNPVTFEMSIHTGAQASDDAVRLAQLERALLLTQVRRSGVSVVDWDIREPLNSVIRSATRSNMMGYL